MPPTSPRALQRVTYLRQERYADLHVYSRSIMVFPLLYTSIIPVVQCHPHHVIMLTNPDIPVCHIVFSNQLTFSRQFRASTDARRATHAADSFRITASHTRDVTAFSVIDVFPTVHILASLRYPPTVSKT